MTSDIECYYCEHLNKDTEEQYYYCCYDNYTHIGFNLKDIYNKCPQKKNGLGL